MAATITTSVVTGGTNSHATSVAEVNATRTDFVTQGVVGTIANTSGVAPATGSFAVNAQSTPAMFVDVTLGRAYITATPAGQTSQNLRAEMTANYTSYAISSNSTGSTKYDWIYLKVDPTTANTPAVDGSDVTALYTSRSSSNTTDNASPPTYGTLLAIVTVANGATSISNANIADSRTNATMSATVTNTYLANFVETGCAWSCDSPGTTLNASMTAGYVWISGKRLRVAAVSARAFTASRDTYVDFTDNLDGTAAVTYTAVTNGAASPALASGAVRVAKIVSGASSIASSSSITQSGLDSLSNYIEPKSPLNLLNNIFGNSVQSQTNAGSAGGSMKYVNLGGIKLVWGQTATQTIGGAAPAVAAVGITLPTSFLTTIQTAIVTANDVSSGSIYAYCDLASASISALSVNFYMTVGTAGQFNAFWFVIGT